MPHSGDRAPDPRPARTRAAIYKAARELAAGDGDVTVNALAKRAGVSRAAFYSHFGGLDDLMGDIIEQMLSHRYDFVRETYRSGAPFRVALARALLSTSEYIAEHHAFLRGALDWTLTHRTYVILVETYAELFELSLGLLGDAVPEHVVAPETARYMSGGTLDLIVKWLMDTEAAALAGEPMDSRALARMLLAAHPAWYTGLQPGESLDDYLDVEPFVPADDASSADARSDADPSPEGPSADGV
ncbi:MAG TPA: TetR/AcrR family transcriptional regulator [Candidatus Brachybacterium merdigallinarum]|nr:TetR/AcrR family transcriptional regulator [Candidatus Brachybacterium merdigallinarum]